MRFMLSIVVACTALLPSGGSSDGPALAAGPQRPPVGRRPAKRQAPKAPVSAEPESHPPATAALQRFDAVIGVWNVIEQHFNRRGKIIATVKGTEEITWILDKHALRRTYTTRSASSVFRAVGSFTWSEADRRYHGVWLNNLSTTGLTSVTGDWTADTSSFVFTLESTDARGRPRRYKVVERLVDDEHRHATTYELHGDGTVAKILEVQYVRAIPCPDRLRTIYDDKLPMMRRKRTPQP